MRQYQKDKETITNNMTNKKKKKITRIRRKQENKDEQDV